MMHKCELAKYFVVGLLEINNTNSFVFTNDLYLDVDQPITIFNLHKSSVSPL